MKAEMDKTRDLTNLAIVANTPTPDNEITPLHFPTSDPISEHFPNNSSTATIPKPPIIDLTTPNPYHASSSHQKSPTPQNPNTNFQNFPSIHQIPTQITQNPPTTQPIPLKTAFHLSISPELYPPFIPHFEPEYSEKKEMEWKVLSGKVEQSIREDVMKAMKGVQYTPDIVGLNYEDLFLGKDEALLIRLFSRSLKGEALEWFMSKEIKQWPSWNALAKDFIERFSYNVEFIPDRYSLERIKQNSTESYREYAYRWRREAARVRPPMTEKEIIEVFVHIQEPEYYNGMLFILGGKFNEIVKIGEAIEDGLKTGKIIRITPQDESSGPLRRKREDVSSISFESSQKAKRRASLNVRKPLPSRTYPLAPQNPHPIQPDYQAPSPYYPNYQAPLPNYLNSQSIRPKPVDTSSKFYRVDQRCEYHSNSVGHDTEDCVNLKHKIQDLIDQRVVTLQTTTPSVNNNPMSNYGGVTINMMRRRMSGAW
ncbi:hypothetical protein R3W88_012348 [Solanum pinnatisectum]|uniref:Retrotransposon gag domain-containing protein n=1 Tax=Solanum pinnatisectum TaxID=50273 RepID=A0AAV9LBD0_9SOLN|nr:hypothetical protein R3W88_012348 [Solanum pinnatisectum]